MSAKRLQQIVEQLDSYPMTRRAFAAQAKPSAKDLALLAVGNAAEAGGFVSTDEVRQFGLTVAYAVIEAALNEDPTLPECFTADDLVIASDVLAGEMSRGWSNG